MYTVIFKTQDGIDYKVSANAGDNLLELAQTAGVPIDAPCSGNGTCGKCLARIMAGTVDDIPNMHLAPEAREDNWRLLCQSSVVADVTLWVPAGAGSFKKGIQTADLSSPEELERYNASIDAIFSSGLVRGCAQEGYGVAVDIGTTTVTAALIDLGTGQVVGKASSGNGQIRYGADVINRIIQQEKPGGREKLQRAVREETLLPIIDELCAQAGIEPVQVARCVIAGNTTMEHLLVGADGSTIRLEPFIPEFLELEGKTSADIGLGFAPDAPVIFAPNVGSYVGGDITAGVLDTMLWTSEQMTLFIDLGTNGELVFGNADFMLTCACSAGPAFEGGDITWGMRATNGAICAATIDEETMEPTFTVIGGGAPVGMCGSGIIDIVAELYRTGIINPRGKFAREGARVLYDESNVGRYVLATREESANGSEIFIDEPDIDNFIRAKGAIFSAIRTMLKSLDMPVEAIERVMIAGGIGSGINMANARAIGMLPNLPAECFSYIGNSSLVGACAMLVSDEAAAKVMELGRNMTYLELSVEPGYMDEFMAACFIPHTDATLFE